MRTFRDAKVMAKAMRVALAEKNIEITHSEALEIVARQFGSESWNILSAKIDRDGEGSDTGTIVFQPPVPIFRIFDEEKARGFYQGLLDCKVDWEHRFEPNLPIYMQVSRGPLKLHLSEHSGDASPGGNMVVYTRGVVELQKRLIAKNYRYNRPGLEEQDWGLECQVIDPFGNRIRFLEPKNKD
jgi:hypothetical protein